FKRLIAEAPRSAEQVRSSTASDGDPRQADISNHPPQRRGSAAQSRRGGAGGGPRGGGEAAGSGPSVARGDHNAEFGACGIPPPQPLPLRGRGIAYGKSCVASATLGHIASVGRHNPGESERKQIRIETRTAVGGFDKYFLAVGRLRRA